MSLIRAIVYYGCVRHLPPSTAPAGRMWRALRRVVCAPMLGACGKNVNIESGAFFGSGRHIQLGDNSGIGINAYLAGRVTIGSNVMMAPDVVILTGGHAISRVDMPMLQQGNVPERPVVIGDDVWIGMRAIILPGVVVGCGAVIGAGAVVAKDVQAWAIVIGNPARVVRYRNEMVEPVPSVPHASSEPSRVMV